MIKKAYFLIVLVAVFFGGLFSAEAVFFDNREACEYYVNEINQALADANQKVLGANLAEAQQSLTTALDLIKSRATLAELIRETKAEFPDWTIPELTTDYAKFSAFNTGLHKERIRKMNYAIKQFEDDVAKAQQYLVKAKVDLFISILSNGLITFVESYNMASGTSVIDWVAEYSTGGGFSAAAEEAKKRADDLAAGFAKKANRQAALKAAEELRDKAIELRAMVREVRWISEQIGGDIEEIKSWLEYRGLTIDKLTQVVVPPPEPPPAWTADPFIHAIDELVRLLNAGDTDWGSAVGLAAKINANAEASYPGDDPVEFSRYEVAYSDYTDLYDQRVADLAVLNSKRDELQAMIDAIADGLAAITIPPSTLAGNLEDASATGPLDPARRCIYDLPWQSGIQVDYENSRFSGYVTPSRLRGIDIGFTRPRIEDGVPAIEAFYEKLWDDGVAVYADASRAAQANRTHAEWHNVPYKQGAQSYATSALTGASLRSCLNNMTAFQEEAEEFASCLAAIESDVVALGNGIPAIESKVAEIDAWINQHPVTLPSAEFIGMTFTDFMGETLTWAHLDDLYFDVTDILEVAPLLSGLAESEAQGLAEKCWQAEELIEEDLAFNQNLGNTAGKWRQLAERMLAFRGDYQGNGYPGVLWDTLSLIDSDIRACFSPEIYGIVVNNVRLTYPELIADLKQLIRYIDSLPGWSLSDFSGLISESRELTDQLLTAQNVPYYQYIENYQGYETDPVEGHLVFPENIEIVNTLIGARWKERRREYSEEMGFLTPDQISSGLPRLRSWLSTQTAAVTAGGEDPYIDFTVTQGATANLNPGRWISNFTEVYVWDEQGESAEDVPVACSYSIGSDTISVFESSDESGRCRFVLEGSLPSGNLELTFKIGARVVLTSTVTVEPDADGDGIGDGTESRMGFDPDFSWDGTMDSDGDGLLDRDELALGLDLNNADSDGDGTPDGVEVSQGSDPLAPNMPQLSDETAKVPGYLSVPFDWVDLDPIDLPWHTSNDRIIKKASLMGKLWIFAQEFSPGSWDDTPEEKCGWSTDGKNWTFEDLNIPTAEFRNADFHSWLDGMSFVSAEGKVWSSTNGYNWRLVSENAPWINNGFGRVGFKTLVQDGTLYLAGGNSSGYQEQDVWACSDGTNWTQVADNLSFLSNRTDFAFFEFNGDLAIAGGYDATKGKSDWSAGYDEIMVSTNGGAEWAVGGFLPSKSGQGPYVDLNHHRIGGKDYFFLLQSLTTFYGLQWILFEYDADAGSYTYPWTRYPGYTIDGGLKFMGELFSIAYNGSVNYSGNRLRFDSGFGDGIPGFAQVRHFTHGGDFYLAIARDGTLWSWGSNGDGQLGLGDSVSRSEPQQVGTNSNWISVEAGQWNMAMALNADGDLFACGRHPYGPLGLGENTTKTNLLTRIEPAGVWTDFSLGYYHTLAQRKDGSLWVWGDNQYDGLGLDSSYTNSYYYTPQPLTLPEAYSNAVVNRLVAGDYYSLVSVTDTNGNESSLFWGGNYKSSVPMAALNVGTRGWLAAELSTDRRMLFLMADGSLKYLTNPAHYYAPQICLSEFERWISMSGAYDSGVAVRTDNTLWQWTDKDADPVQIGTDCDWIAVKQNPSSYSASFMAQKTDGSLWVSATGGRMLPVKPFGADALADTDSDGLPDWYEMRYRILNAEQGDADSDDDQDMLTAAEEYQIGTNPMLDDTDGDGLPDGYEHRFGLDPLNPPAPSTGSVINRASWSTGGDVWSYGVKYHDGTHLYVMAGWEDGLVILDASDPTNMTQVGSWDLFVNNGWVTGTVEPAGMVRIGDLLYMGHSSGLTVLDLSDISNPAIAADKGIAGGDFGRMQLLEVQWWAGDRTLLFVDDGPYGWKNNINLLEVNADGTLTNLSTLATGNFPGDFACSTNGWLVCGREEGGVVLWDFGALTQPREEAYWNDSGFTAGAFRFVGDRICAVGTRNKSPVWVLLEKQGNQLVPVEERSLAAEWTSIEGSVQNESWWVFAARGDESAVGFMPLQVTDPANPQLLPSWSTTNLWQPPEMALNGDGLFAGTSSGVQAFELQTLDSDGDGLLDSWELTHWGNLSAASGLDDSDGDGLLNILEQQVGTKPLLADTDGDGTSDGDEVLQALNPLGITDSDGDGVSDQDEVVRGTDPNSEDSDGDGVPDGHEIILGTDPSDPDAYSAPFRAPPAVAGPNGVKLNVPSLPGRVYIVEYKNSLTDPTWTELTRRDGTDGTLAVEDVDQADGRFYRVRVQMK